MDSEQPNAPGSHTSHLSTSDALRESRQQLADRIRHEHLHGTGKRSIARKVLTVALLAAVCAALLWFQSTSATNEDAGSVAAPANATEGFGFIVGSGVPSDQDGESGARPPDALVPVVIFEDFMCPSCKTFYEQTVGLLASYADSGTISLEYRPLAFLNNASNDEYSQRAANAAACVADVAGTAAFVAMQELLFENQPVTGGSGLSDDELTDFARDAGAAEAASCISERNFDVWIIQASDAAIADGVSSAPTVRVAGTSILNTSNGREAMPGPDELRLAIDQAAQ